MLSVWHGPCVRVPEGWLGAGAGTTHVREHSVDDATRPGSVGLRLIGAYKLVKALVLVALGYGILHLVSSDVTQDLEHWRALLRLDPTNHFVQVCISKLSGIDRHNLRLI